LSAIKTARYNLKARKRMQEVQEAVPQSTMVVAPIIKRPMPDDNEPQIHPAIEKYKDLVPLQNLKTQEEIQNSTNLQLAVIQRQQLIEK
jgi:hypothetical protein